MNKLTLLALCGLALPLTFASEAQADGITHCNPGGGWSSNAPNGPTTCHLELSAVPRAYTEVIGLSHQECEDWQEENLQRLLNKYANVCRDAP